MQTATHGTVAVQDLEPVRLRIKTKYKIKVPMAKPRQEESQ